MSLCVTLSTGMMPTSALSCYVPGANISYRASYQTEVQMEIFCMNGCFLKPIHHTQISIQNSGEEMFNI